MRKRFHYVDTINWINFMRKSEKTKRKICISWFIKNQCELNPNGVQFETALKFMLFRIQTYSPINSVAAPPDWPFNLKFFCKKGHPS